MQILLWLSKVVETLNPAAGWTEQDSQNAIRREHDRRNRGNSKARIQIIPQNNLSPKENVFFIHYLFRLAQTALP